MIVVVQHKIYSDRKDVFNGVFKCDFDVINRENTVINMKFKDGTYKAKEVDNTVYDIKIYND